MVGAHSHCWDMFTLLGHVNIHSLMCTVRAFNTAMHKKMHVKAHYHKEKHNKYLLNFKCCSAKSIIKKLSRAEKTIVLLQTLLLHTLQMTDSIPGMIEPTSDVVIEYYIHVKIRPHNFSNRVHHVLTSVL